MRTYLFYFLLGVCVWLVIFQLDSNQQMALPLEGEIPQEAIRLRILANSDQIEDQWLKRKVRDEVVQEMQGWAMKPKNIEEARQMIKQRLPHFQKIAKETIHRYGHTDSVKVDFAKVPFPTKLYGTKVYPAGNYEALRITIGKGEGGNWWCVLFPPLCFVDMSNGDAIPEEKKGISTLSTSIAPTSQVFAASTPLKEKEKAKKSVHVRFLFLDQLSKVAR